VFGLSKHFWFSKLFVFASTEISYKFETSVHPLFLHICGKNVCSRFFDSSGYCSFQGVCIMDVMLNKNNATHNYHRHQQPFTSICNSEWRNYPTKQKWHVWHKFWAKPILINQLKYLCNTCSKTSQSLCLH